MGESRRGMPPHAPVTGDCAVAAAAGSTAARPAHDRRRHAPRFRLDRMASSLVAAIVLAGCGGGGSTRSPDPQPGPWDFPAATGHALVLRSEQTSCAVGDSVDVKLTAYDLPPLSGAALRIDVPSELLAAGRILRNPQALPSGEAMLTVERIEPDSGRVSWGFSFVRGSGRTFSGSAVLLLLRCRALESGSAYLRLDRGTLDLRDSAGSRMAGLENIRLDPLTLLVL